MPQAPSLDRMRDAADGMEIMNWRQLPPGEVTPDGAGYELIFGEMNELGNVEVGGTYDPNSFAARKPFVSPNEDGTPVHDFLRQYADPPKQ